MRLIMFMEFWKASLSFLKIHPGLLHEQLDFDFNTDIDFDCHILMLTLTLTLSLTFHFDFDVDFDFGFDFGMHVGITLGSFLYHVGSFGGGSKNIYRVYLNTFTSIFKWYLLSYVIIFLTQKGSAKLILELQSEIGRALEYVTGGVHPDIYINLSC